MSFYDTLFILQFLAVITLLGLKLYNLMSVGEFYDFKIAVLTFIGYFLAWGVGLIVIMVNPTEVIYFQLLKIETWFILLIVVSFIAEVFYYLKDVVVQPRQAYKPQR